MEDVDKDNSELLDAGAATQQLSTDDIAALRAAGKTGRFLIQSHMVTPCVPIVCSYQAVLLQAKKL